MTTIDKALAAMQAAIPALLTEHAPALTAAVEAAIMAGGDEGPEPKLRFAIGCEIVPRGQRAAWRATLTIRRAEKHEVEGEVDATPGLPGMGV